MECSECKHRIFDHYVDGSPCAVYICGHPNIEKIEDGCPLKILHLTLKKQWFDLIASGKKKYEYREDKPYWRKRLVENDEGKNFDIVRFKNGYSKTAQYIDVEFKGISFTSDKWWTPKHGEEFKGNIIVISLGKILGITNRST